MTVFLSHAAADRETAEALETFLERRGSFVERDDGEQALRPVQSNDVVVLLHSKDFVFSPTRLRLEQRALDAWAAGRLVMVKLDNNFAPVGLRDLPFIDASFEAQREFKWQEVANAIREAQQRPATPPPPPPGKAKAPWDAELDQIQAQSQSQAQSSDNRAQAEEVREKARRASRTSLVVGVLAMLPGLAALAVSAAIWLVNRIGPTPGSFADLVRGIDQFGAARGAPPGATPVVFAFFIAVTVLAPVAMFIIGRVQRGQLDAYAREHPEIYEDYEGPLVAPRTDALFVSYARANAAVVMPVIEAAKSGGRKFWIDTEGIVSGDGWAGEIVRAIKNAAGVVVMCSKASFESDHVKREIYLADRYHKKLVPVFVEDAAPPEDFEYFFAGVQALKLFETPEAERGAALLKALQPA